MLHSLGTHKIRTREVSQGDTLALNEVKSAIGWLFVPLPDQNLGVKGRGDGMDALRWKLEVAVTRRIWIR